MLPLPLLVDDDDCRWSTKINLSAIITKIDGDETDQDDDDNNDGDDDINGHGDMILVGDNNNASNDNMIVIASIHIITIVITLFLT